jgi:hypothetical protein
LINKEEVYKKVKNPNTKVYSTGMILPNFLAPASTYKRASTLILSAITKEGITCCGRP